MQGCLGECLPRRFLLSSSAFPPSLGSGDEEGTWLWPGRPCISTNATVAVATAAAAFFFHVLPSSFIPSLFSPTTKRKKLRRTEKFQSRGEGVFLLLEERREAAGKNRRTPRKRDRGNRQLPFFLERGKEEERFFFHGKEDEDEPQPKETRNVLAPRPSCKNFPRVDRVGKSSYRSPEGKLAS